MTVHKLPANVQAVVFDVDNTIVKGTTVYHAAVSMKLISQSDRRNILRLASHNLVYTIFSFENGLDFLKQEGLTLIKGCDSLMFKTHLREHLTHKIDKKVYTEILETIKQYKKENKIIILASAAPDFLVEIVATKVGANYYIGTKLEEENGVFTGATVGPVNHGEHKAVNVKKLLDTLCIEKLNVAAFTDSSKDIHLLRSAEHKIAVNPDLVLRYASHKNNWTTIDVSPKYALTKIAGVATATGMVYFASKLLFKLNKKARTNGS